MLRRISMRGSDPCVIAWEEEYRHVVSGMDLALRAASFTQQLKARGIEENTVVGLRAANGPDWMEAALAALAMKVVLMPLDHQLAAQDVVDRLKQSRCRWLIGARGGWNEIQAALDGHQASMIFFHEVARDRRAQADQATLALQDLLADDGPDFDDAAVRFFTSGTTGRPKSFDLTYANLAANITGLAELGIVHSADRVLLPLPLHHAYPFIVGMLTGLTAGTTLILPKAITGPAIVSALHSERITTIVGVPRLYELLVDAIERRVGKLGAIPRFTFRFLTRASRYAWRRARWRPGRFVFAPLRRRVAPDLRVLVSGGAPLDPAQEAKLEAWGWVVLVGYGLSETASVFTCNRPASRRIGSAGHPLSGGRIRIAQPQSDGVGEVMLHGPQITSAYLDNPRANAEAFTNDGWFRTGDLGRLEPDGSLTIVGRVKEMIVLGGGKNLNPETLEKGYQHRPEIEEIAILEDKGALVAIVKPNVPAVYEMGATNLRDGIRVVLAEEAQALPSHERLTGFRLTSAPLPKTRLGKYQRFKLLDLYRRLGEAQVAPAKVEMSDDDLALLRDPLADGLWQLLRQRFPDLATSLDIHPHLDLNLDSFGWMNLSIGIEERFGRPLSETDIAQATSLRDLITSYTASAGDAQEQSTATGDASVPMEVEQWLRPTGAVHTLLGLSFYALNWFIMRVVFRLRVVGAENLPRSGPYVIAPNHVSDLDPLAIAATLSPRQIKSVYWSGEAKRLFFSRLSRAFCRISHIFPVSETRPKQAVEAAIGVLQRGKALGWFCEGWRSPDGRLQRFLPGIGVILREAGVPTVPAFISGTFEALPRGRRTPVPHRIVVAFGEPVSDDALEREGDGGSAEERIADGLRQRVARLNRPISGRR